MNRTNYKNRYNDEHYDRINLSVPKGMKKVMRDMAADAGMTLNAYLLHLIAKEQQELYDQMQLSAYAREKLLTIRGNTHDGYEVIFRDGRSIRCRTKLEIRRCLAQYRQNLAQDT